ncbi:MAG: DNA photolyase [Planctomycetota bacterium]|nr:DNA photolyase [Planctomycetota bacterium]
MKVHQTRLSTGITRTKEFERKRLASFAVNVGTKCGHDCLYCSTGALLRMHRSFKEAGQNPFGHGYAIVDPETPGRVAADAQRIRHRGMVQICTVVDAWAPEAHEYRLGRKCLESILAESGWTVRILTKNAAVAEDFDLLEKHRDRVLIGLSITGTADKGRILGIIEPHASPIEQRMATLREARARGLRTYGMLCPLLPGIADAPEQIDELVQLVAQCGAEEVFIEPINPRGPALRVTQEALFTEGYTREAAAIGQIRRRDQWSRYVLELIRHVQTSMQRHSDLGKLRFLLYPTGLTPGDLSEIHQNDTGVIWLGKD